jgi:hypothetical protein
LHAVVQKAEFAQALAQYLVVEVGVGLKDFQVGQKVHLGAALFGVANHLHGRHLNAVDGFNHAVLHKAFAEFQHMHLAVAAHRQAQHFAQGH